MPSASARISSLAPYVAIGLFGVELSGPIDTGLERIGDLFEDSERAGEECYLTFM